MKRNKIIGLLLSGVMMFGVVGCESNKIDMDYIEQIATIEENNQYGKYGGESILEILQFDDSYMSNEEILLKDTENLNEAIDYLNKDVVKSLKNKEERDQFLCYQVGGFEAIKYYIECRIELLDYLPDENDEEMIDYYNQYLDILQKEYDAFDGRGTITNNEFKELGEKIQYRYRYYK